ncbi:MAG: hypothetical protein LBB74_10010 [Chitinispirillales bacterium]|jgi:hypothetical protein|nr:hypothetical protein [Chitinispirillales bacterium]
MTFIARRIFLSLAALLFFAGTAYSQVSPYIADVVGEDGTVVSAGGEDGGDGDLRLIGTFKIFNPDTVPFYLWLSFKNGGRLAHSRREQGSPSAVRLVDMELRYFDVTHRPIVREFPDNAGPRVRPRLGWTSSTRGGSGGAAGRFGRKKAHIEQSENTASSVRHRSMGAVEIVFWQEDAQAYYEMELWGVLYAPDLKKVAVKGRYIEHIKLDIEAAK